VEKKQIEVLEALLMVVTTGDKSDAELASIENGFWSCAIHGREIDTNQGRAYSAEELFSWKRLREEQARNERSGLNISAPGWLDRITVPESPLFRPGSAQSGGLERTGRPETNSGPGDRVAVRRLAREALGCWASMRARKRQRMLVAAGLAEGEELGSNLLHCKPKQANVGRRIQA
jgi:hypothetical protein